MTEEKGIDLCCAGNGNLMLTQWNVITPFAQPHICVQQKLDMFLIIKFMRQSRLYVSGKRKS